MTKIVSYRVHHSTSVSIDTCYKCFYYFVHFNCRFNYF